MLPLVASLFVFHAESQDCWVWTSHLDGTETAEVCHVMKPENNQLFFFPLLFLEVETFGYSLTVQDRWLISLLVMIKLSVVVWTKNG